jgi:arabinofuranan 3-O-arabinosyltransferase
MTAVDQAQGPPGAPQRAPTRMVASRRRRRPSVRLSRWIEHLRWAYVNRLWPTMVILYGLASLATLTSARGAYIGDNRFEQYWNPARRIARTFTVWDGSRGLGRVREDLWPATTVPPAVLRALGFPPPIAEVLFHSLLISLAGLGTVALVRLFRPGIGFEHLLAGLFVSFGAYSATFLLPSNLYYSFTLTPWLLVIVFRGVHSARPWRWAAVLALVVTTPGNVDLPGLVYGALPVAALVLYLVAVERSVRIRHVAGWFVRVAVLALPANAAMLVKTYLGVQTLGQRLGDTESADVSAFTSSWTETLRGLGNWLSYFRDGTGLLKPQGEVYFTNWFVIAATFVPPAVALYVLWQSRWRGRLLFALLIILPAVIMVGGYPLGGSSPLGGRLLGAYLDIPALGAFRNTYKVGAGLTIGVSVLFAYGVMLAYRSLRRSNPGWRAAPILAAMVTLAGVAVPFWTGQLYHPDRRMGPLPEYWTQAFDHLADKPEDGRTLVLPQTSRAQYRWGWVGDDIFDALNARDHAVMTGVPLSNPVAANLLEAVTLVASDPNYVPGTLAPLMRRLGLTEILLRNDLDWEHLSRPRPSSFDALRTDPDLRRTRTFGRPGQNTADSQDRSVAGDRDRAYPPVEIWELVDPVGPVTTVPAGAPLLVSGDGFGWAAMAQAGLLDGAQPVAFTAGRDRSGLLADLEAGSPLVVTDSNRRRLRVVLAYEADYSHTLADGQDLDRPTGSLWSTEGAQSVAWHSDATAVTLSGSPRSIVGSLPWARPANALDGDPSSAWTVRLLEEPVGRTIGIELRQPTEIAAARIVQPRELPAGIIAARLRFSDGSTVPVELDGHDTTVELPARTTTSVELIIDQLAPEVFTVGVAELSFPGVDLAEHIQAPDDVFRRAEGDPELDAALRAAPVGYSFSRSVRPTSQTSPLPVLFGTASTDEESGIRRRFRVAGERDLEVGGRLRLRPDTDDVLIDRLIGGERGAVASVRHRGALEGIGAHVVDGDRDTAWLAPAEPEVTVTLRFPRQEVRSVDLTTQIDGISSGIEAFRVETTDPADRDRVIVHGTEGSGGSTASEPARGSGGAVGPADPACASGRGCVQGGRVTLDRPLVTDHLTVRITGVSGRDAAAGGRIRVDEVQLNGRDNQPLLRGESRPEPCRALGVRVDGAGGAAAGFNAVGMTVDATLSELLAGRSVPVSGCSPVRLGDGWHTVDTGLHAPFDELHLLEPALTERIAAAPATHRSDTSVLERSPTEWKLRVRNNQPGSILLLNQSHDAGWRATVNGVPIGGPRELNGINTWTLHEPGALDIELRYQPRRLLGYALPVSAGALILCFYLALRRPRDERRGRITDPNDPPAAVDDPLIAGELPRVR